MMILFAPYGWSADAGNYGQLNSAIQTVNDSESGDSTVNITGNITTTGLLRPLNVDGTFMYQDLTISVLGNGHTLTTSGTHPLFFVGGNLDGSAAHTVTISNLTLTNGKAKGGNGGSASGGGGGAGMGGALFIANGASVSLDTVTFGSCSAIGGQGQLIPTPLGVAGGGGGGMYGNGGYVTLSSPDDGGGGGGGFGGDGARSTNTRGGGGGGSGGGAPSNGSGGPDFNGSSPSIGSAASSGQGGAGCISSGNPNTGGYGGGGGGGGISTCHGGNGGFGGGGGGSSYNNESLHGGDGGFGGGGGSGYNPGNGGFGGGGALGYAGFGTGGFAGGDGTSSRAGGGAGLGGAIFIQNGGSCTIGDSVSFSGNSVTGGAGGNNGSAYGSDIFLMTGANLTFTNGTDITIPHAIESDQGAGGGTGGLFLMNGTGTLTLEGAYGASTAFTIPTTISQGTLILNPSSGNALQSTSVANEGTLQIDVDQTVNNLTGSGTVALGGNTLSVITSTAGEMGGIIAGTGGFTKLGTSTLTLSGANTYTGATTISNGTLVLDRASGNVLQSSSVVNSGILSLSTNQTVKNLTGNGSVQLNENTLTITTSTDGEIGGVMEGDGGIAKNGAGALTLSGINTFSGDVSILAATLVLSTFSGNAVGLASAVANGGALQIDSNQTVNNLSGTGSVVLGGNTLTANNTTSTEVSGVISGSGAVKKTGSSQLTLSGVNTYSGGTQLVGGSLILGNAQGFGTGDVTVSDGSTWGVNDDSTITNNFSLSSGTSTVALSDHDFTLSGDISGGGALNKTGSGTLTLNGANTFTGGITIESGGVTTGSFASTGRVSMEANTTFTLSDSLQLAQLLGGNGGTVAIGSHTLTVNNFLNGELGAGLTGSGALEKSGIGTLILSGVSSFSGSTTVSGGILRVNGTLPSAITVNSAGVLSGKGTTGTVTNNGAVRPGSSIGTLTIAGNYVQGSNATLQIELGTNGESDLVFVTSGGTATLDGDLDFFLQPGTHLKGDTYTFLRAPAGIIGNWTSNNASTLPFAYDLVVGSTTAELTVQSNVFFLDKQITGYNPRAVNRYLEDTTTEDSLLLRSYILQMDALDESQLSNALNTMHPALYGANGLVQESHTTFIDTNLTAHPTEDCLICDKTSDGFRTHAIWVKGFSQFLDVEPTDEMFKNDSHASGGMLGYDYSFEDKGAIGAAAGYSYTSLDWKSGYAKGRVNSYFFGVYGDYYIDTWTVNGSLRAGYDAIDQARHVLFAANNFSAMNSHHAWEFDVRLAAECILKRGPYQTKPYLSLNLFNIWENGFTENGAGVFDLDVEGKYSGYLRSSAGIEFSREIRMNRSTLCPLVRLGGVNIAQLSNEDYTANFVGIEQTFVTHTYDKIWTLIDPGIGLSYTHDGGVSATLFYDVQINGTYFLQMFDARVTFRF